ncbi:MULTISPECIES: hypothetical protein [Pseudoalteromonas]|uniref:hypothetical protein n=1 Tax=Pseudoalteromonas TaxID=53246 RepID=UPI0007858AF1|nr:MULTISPECIES: hypothetical protein [Gammaproteobacteria]MCF7519011.1 hypothetical protein [Pseudoalteromonas sp. L21]
MLEKDILSNKLISYNGSNSYSYELFKQLPDKNVFTFVATNNCDDYQQQLFEQLDALTINQIVHQG